VSGLASPHTTGGSNRPDRRSSPIRMPGRGGACGPPAPPEGAPLADLAVEDDEGEGLEAPARPERLRRRHVGGREDLTALAAEPLRQARPYAGIIRDDEDGGVRGIRSPVPEGP
jgi:hypothetical protein